MDDPRVSDSSNVMSSTYMAWMNDRVSQPAPYIKHGRPIHPNHLLDLMRFRLGVHWLAVVTGRWSNPVDGTAGGVPRPYRRCRKCSEGCIEDERHFLMECQSYSHIRAMFSDLYSECDDSMVKLMCHPKQYKVALLVHTLRCFRDSDCDHIFDTHLDGFDSD